CGYPGDVLCDCRWNERPVFALKCSARLAAISAKVRSVDAACETIHGLSAIGHTVVPSLRAWCPAWLGRSDLGKLFSARNQCRLLDEGRLRSANGVGTEAKCRLRAHVRARAWKRHLFHWRQISIDQCRVSRFTTSRRLAGIYTRAFASGAGAGALGVCRFYRGMVSYLQI